MSKSKSPAFRFYPSDFMGSPDVQAMDLHEVGAYTFLLCTAWLSDRHGYLPDDDERLRRWAHMSREQWAESRAVLLAKFPVVEGGWRANERMVLEAGKQAAYSETQSRKGRLGGRPKKAEIKPEVSTEEAGASKSESPEKPSVSVSVSVSASALGNSSSNEEESKSADAPADTRKRRMAKHSSAADGPATIDELRGTGFEIDDFTAYMTVRRKKHCAFIDLATRERWIAKFRKHYAEGKDTQDMLHQMIEGQWLGAVAEKWKQRPKELVATDDPAAIWPEFYGTGSVQ